MPQSNSLESQTAECAFDLRLQQTVAKKRTPGVRRLAIFKSLTYLNLKKKKATTCVRCLSVVSVYVLLFWGLDFLWTSLVSFRSCTLKVSKPTRRQAQTCSEKGPGWAWHEWYITRQPSTPPKTFQNKKHSCKMTMQLQNDSGGDKLLRNFRNSSGFSMAKLFKAFLCASFLQDSKKYFTLPVQFKSEKNLSERGFLRSILKAISNIILLWRGSVDSVDLAKSLLFKSVRPLAAAPFQRAPSEGTPWSKNWGNNWTLLKMFLCEGQPNYRTA